jgi:hypothetical protein
MRHGFLVSRGIILFHPILADLIRLSCDLQQPTQLDFIHSNNRIIPFSTIVVLGQFHRPTLHLPLEGCPYAAPARETCRTRTSCVAHDQRRLRLESPSLAEGLEEVVFVVWRRVKFVRGTERRPTDVQPKVIPTEWFTSGDLRLAIRCRPICRSENDIHSLFCQCSSRSRMCQIPA